MKSINLRSLSTSHHSLICAFSNLILGILWSSSTSNGTYHRLCNQLLFCILSTIWNFQPVSIMNHTSFKNLGFWLVCLFDGFVDEQYKEDAREHSSLCCKPPNGFFRLGVFHVLCLISSSDFNHR